MNMADNKLESREPQFAEYSLWNDSAYTMFNEQPFNRIEFMRPVASSIFLSPPNLDLLGDRNEEVIDVDHRREARTRSSPGFERYMKRALKVVTREDLMKDPALFKKDPESDSEEGTSHSSRNQDIFLRPPRPRWRTAQQVTGRGRRMNLMQRRLEQALSQPARIERGASMMQRMGWQGGALGRGRGGITEPIAPDPYYANSTAGFGLASESAADSQDSGTEEQTKRPKGSQQQKTKKALKNEFKINVLQYIREFVKNDLQIELFFESKLKPIERKRIHVIVSKLMGEETDEVQFNTMEMEFLVQDIERRNAYVLGTQSEGDAPNRQICIYKEATEHMYLVTPDDVRHPQPDEQEEETNPFLKSIVRHLKSDATPPKEYTMLDRIIDYFVEFSEQDTYTEFRFLGAYNIDEIEVMSSFFGMVSCIIKKGSYVDCPERLVRSFEKGVEYTADEDVNGFVSIKKWVRVKLDKNKEKTEEVTKRNNEEVK